MKVLGLSRWSDENQNPETDPVKITAAIDDFRNLAIGIMLGQEVEKSGRKISSARLSKLKNIEALIGEILSDANNEELEGEETVIQEEVTKTVAEAIRPVVERIEKLEGTLEPKEEAKGASLEEIQKAVNDAMASLMTRLEKVENARGMSNKVPEDTSVEKSGDDFWGNIF